MNRFLSLSISLILFSTLLFSCSSGPKWEKFDAIQWKTDARGCNGYRLDHYEIILENKENLMGKGGPEIKKWLGKPDENELYTRSQRFFHYDIYSPEHCDDKGKPHWRLSIRFDALNRVNEVSVWKQ